MSKRQKRRTNEKKEQNYGVQFAGIIVFMAVLFLAQISLLILYYRDIRVRLTNQVDTDLKETTELSAEFLNNFLENTESELGLVADLCDAPDGSGKENWRQSVEESKDDFYRLGVADATGTICYAGGETAQISEADYYKEAMSGEVAVSGVLPRNYLGRDTVVIAAPIFDEKQRAEGCVCLEYTAEYVGKFINKEDTQGLGATLVVDSDGYVAASYPGMEEFDTFYEMLETKDFKGENSPEEFRKLLNSDGDGYYHYYYNNRERYLYYQPLKIKDWTIITLVMRQSFKVNLGEVWKRSWWLLISVMTLSAVFFLSLLRLRKLRQKEAKRGQKDALTHVYTREAAVGIVKHSLHSREVEAYYDCCLFLDIDNFKEINDKKGHIEGDETLAKVGSLLTGRVRRRDLVSRYGGDEFNLWLWNIADQDIAVRAAQRIVEAFREQTGVTVSIGVTMFTDKEEDPTEVLKRADKALYMAKRNGRDQVYVL